MAKNKAEWEYVCSDSSFAGLMVCSGCGEKIKSGQYKYQMGVGGCVTFHRKCSADDEEWSKIDHKKRVWLRGYKEQLSDYQKLKGKWGCSALDMDIENVQRCIQALERYFTHVEKEKEAA